MSGPARVAVIAIGIACIVMAVYNAVTPDRNTAGLFGLQSDGVHARLIVAVPSPGPIQALSGDELDVGATTARSRIAYFGAASIGSTIHVPILRNGRTENIALVVPQGETTPSRYIDLVLVILECSFGVIVMLRAGAVPLAHMVIWLVIVEEVGTVFADFAYTAPSGDLGFLVGLGTAPLYGAGTSFVALWAVLLLPGVRWKRTPPVAAGLVLLTLVAGGNTFDQILAVWFPLLPTIWVDATVVGAIAISLVLAIALAFVANAAPADQRMRSMWFVSSLIGWFVGEALSAAYQFVPALWVFWIAYLLQSFTLIGPIYAVLRHRMLDLNFVITRSAIYAVFSIAMIGSFVAAEEGADKVTGIVLARSPWQGTVSQLLSFSVAIVIGLYLRSAHGRLERWVNGMLFRERIRKLQLLESFSREADLLQTRSELLRVTQEALADSIDAREMAVYVATDGALVCAHGTGAAAERLDRSDRLVLQLLERQRPFVSEVASLRHWLIIPLSVRRQIVGAIAGGPKRDHTEYLPDELRTLVDVAHRVATSYALLLPAFGAAPPPFDTLRVSEGSSG